MKRALGGCRQERVSSEMMRRLVTLLIVLAGCAVQATEVQVGRRASFLASSGSFTLSSGSNRAGNDESMELGVAGPTLLDDSVELVDATRTSNRSANAMKREIHAAVKGEKPTPKAVAAPPVPEHSAKHRLATAPYTMQRKLKNLIDWQRSSSSMLCPEGDDPDAWISEHKVVATEQGTGEQIPVPIYCAVLPDGKTGKVEFKFLPQSKEEDSDELGENNKKAKKAEKKAARKEKKAAKKEKKAEKKAAKKKKKAAKKAGIRITTSSGSVLIDLGLIGSRKCPAVKNAIKPKELLTAQLLNLPCTVAAVSRMKVGVLGKAAPCKSIKRFLGSGTPYIQKFTSKSDGGAVAIQHSKDKNCWVTSTFGVRKFFKGGRMEEENELGEGKGEKKAARKAKKEAKKEKKNEKKAAKWGGSEQVISLQYAKIAVCKKRDDNGVVYVDKAGNASPKCANKSVMLQCKQSPKTPRSWTSCDEAIKEFSMATI